MKSKVKLNKVGYEVIHPESQCAAGSLVKILLNRDWYTLLSAECQQGKTNVATQVIHSFFTQAKQEEKTLHVIFISADAKNTLRDQIGDRLFFHWDESVIPHVPHGANFADTFKSASIDAGNSQAYILSVVHRSELHKLVLHKTDRRLVILDECHIAEIAPGSGARVQGEINRFLARCGIDLTLSPKSWAKGGAINYLLAISATPYTWQTAQREIATLQTVVLRRSPFYMGLPELYDANRLLPLEMAVMLNVGGEFVPSPHFTETILPRFLKECRWRRRAGYALIRLQGKALVAFRLWCRDNKYPFREATISSGEIQDIKSILNDEVDEPTFLLISGLFRAGMTITNDSNIRMVVETTALSGSAGVDSLTQGLVGRSMGYGKTNPYPIFCNMEKVEESLRYILEMRKGANATVRVPRNKHVEHQGEKGERYHYIRHETNPLPEKNPRKQSRNKMDFAAMIASGAVRTAHGEGEVFHIDQMTTSDDESIHPGVALGYYIRGEKRKGNGLTAVLKAQTPFTSPSARMH